MNTTTTPITLTGYLGQDRSIRETPGRTYTRHLPPTVLQFELGGVTSPDEPLWESFENSAYEVTTPSREYAVLSLATHSWKNGERQTRWHRVYAWNLDRHEFMNVRMCRKGDKVRVTCRPRTFKSNDGKLIECLDLVGLETLKARAPEVP